MKVPTPGSVPAGPRTADSLWSFLWGKRRSRRHAVSLPARLLGAQAVPTAQALDLSRHGALLRVAVSDLAALDGLAGSSALFAAGNVFGDGFVLQFSGGVRAHGRLVRVSWRPGDDAAVYLGCEFVEPLDAIDLARLGLSRRQCSPETGVGTPPATLMSHVADPDCALSLTVLDPGGLPIYVGRLVGIQGCALAIHLMPADPTSVVARLSRKAHTVLVAPRGAKAWTSEAYLLAVRLLDGRADAVEVVFKATAPPNRSIVRRMRPRAGREGAPRARALKSSKA